MGTRRASYPGLLEDLSSAPPARVARVDHCFRGDHYKRFAGVRAP